MIPQNKYISKYMQIMRLAKARTGIHFKLQIANKKATILIHDMDRDQVILAEEYNENKPDTVQKLKNDLHFLTKRLGKVNQKMRDMLVEYMNLYNIMAHIVLQDSLEIIFASIQHTRQQTSIAILDKNKPYDAPMMFIDE
jgi:septum formation topological specificity factor MinE